MNIIIDIDVIFDIQNKLKNINSHNLKDIKFYDRGKKLDIPEEIILSFQMTGLNNFDFITSGFYLKK